MEGKQGIDVKWGIARMREHGTPGMQQREKRYTFRPIGPKLIID